MGSGWLGRWIIWSNVRNLQNFNIRNLQKKRFLVGWGNYGQKVQGEVFRLNVRTALAALARPPRVPQEDPGTPSGELPKTRAP